MNEQLILELKLHDDNTFENFAVGENLELVSNLKNFAKDHTEPFIYISGQSGTGRTHLLHACCHLAREEKKHPFYLSLKHRENLSPLVLHDLNVFNLVCLDDLQAIAGDSEWEEGVFHLFNELRAAHTKLLVASELPVAQLGLETEDLVSRLTWGLSFQLKSLKDQDKIDNLQQRAKRRGFEINEEVLQYLLRHYERDMPALIGFLDQLDYASLQAQHKITIPFVKEVLNRR